ncbi:MAG: beta-ketoacyl-[acyl-carrier-protein] synthase family protein [Pirellulales bacterium]|nr:beta-ketoacyl-[acyl-carrier-protein] synthase family protein [Pirellulales bacterium]
MTMRRRVVITGMGCLTPVGNDVESMWKAVLAGQSGVGPTTLFDASNFPTRISAEVKNWDIGQAGEDPALWQSHGRHTQFAVGAARQAVRDAGLEDGKFDPLRFGIYLGSGEGQQNFDHFSQMMVAALRDDGSLDVAAFTRKGLEILDPTAELEQEPNMAAAHLAGLFNAQGPNANCLTACSASAQALGEAAEMIRRGDVDLMLSGGTHSMIHPFGVTGFNLLTALSTSNDQPTKASRPFDLHRDGFVLGEGAAMLILEEYEHARRRGAKIHGELRGYGSTADAYRITDIHPEGRGAAACIQMALADAGLNVTDLHYINAHGTSTTVNDKTETMAIKRALGEHAYKVPVSSTKSMMGHLIAAGGATELIICLLAIRDNVLPPTINYETPDPNCDLDYVPNQARPGRCDYAASNSFGFGGQNITLIAGRFAA